jgi:hypothetical protein
VEVLKLIIASELSVEDLKSNIQNNADLPPPPKFSWNPFNRVIPVGIILADFDGNDFKIRQIDLAVRNDFRPIFYGKIVSTEKGSEIVGEFKMNLFTRILVYVARVFCGIVLLVMGLGVVRGLIHHKTFSKFEWKFTFGFLFFFIMTLLFSKFGKFLSPTAVPDITKFLNRCAQKNNH